MTWLSNYAADPMYPLEQYIQCTFHSDGRVYNILTDTTRWVELNEESTGSIEIDLWWIWYAAVTLPTQLMRVIWWNEKINGTHCVLRRPYGE